MTNLGDGNGICISMTTFVKTLIYDSIPNDIIALFKALLIHSFVLIFESSLWISQRKCGSVVV